MFPFSSRSSDIMYRSNTTHADQDHDDDDGISRSRRRNGQCSVDVIMKWRSFVLAQIKREEEEEVDTGDVCPNAIRTSSGKQE